MNDHEKLELNDDELDLVSGGAQQETVALKSQPNNLVPCVNDILGL